jgi:hypothetical protein
MEDLLATSQRLKKSLGFVIIMPCWRDDEVCAHGSGSAEIRHCKRCAWNQISSSEYLAKAIVLASGEHSYTEVAKVSYYTWSSGVSTA